MDEHFEHCSKRYVFDLITDHMASCDSKPIQCTCGVTVPLNNMDFHEIIMCADTLFDCPLCEVGCCGVDCSGTVRRGEFAQHIAARSNATSNFVF
jgi:hypothetical protein